MLEVVVVLVKLVLDSEFLEPLLSLKQQRVPKIQLCLSSTTNFLHKELMITLPQSYFCSDVKLGVEVISI